MIYKKIQPTKTVKQKHILEVPPRSSACSCLGLLTRYHLHLTESPHVYIAF